VTICAVAVVRLEGIGVMKVDLNPPKVACNHALQSGRCARTIIG
jgi:hypothetical protein